MLRLLTFTTLYPNREQPFHGLFVERRLQRLVATNEVRSMVVAPVPWFPFKGPRFGRYARFACVPSAEERYGLKITHPRYPVIPRVGMTLAATFMARAVARHVMDLQRRDDFDIVDAHYFYPDGVAAVRLGRRLGRPVVVTARGSDINLLARYPGPRRQILWAAKNCAAIVAVSAALKVELTKLGVTESKINVLRNGVDLDEFRQEQPDPELRPRTAEWVFLTVGKLIEGKGQHLALRALAGVPGAALWIAGDGPMRAQLENLAHGLGMADRVKFLGQLSREALVRYYSAADATILASAREGMPNVVLESLACGTPVIASSVGGIPEVVTSSTAGVLVDELSPEAFRGAISAFMGRPRDRAGVRMLAESLAWEPTIRAQLALYRDVARQRGIDVVAAGVQT